MSKSFQAGSIRLCSDLYLASQSMISCCLSTRWIARSAYFHAQGDSFYALCVKSAELVKLVLKVLLLRWLWLPQSLLLVSLDYGLARSFHCSMLTSQESGRFSYFQRSPIANPWWYLQAQSCPLATSQSCFCPWSSSRTRCWGRQDLLCCVWILYDHQVPLAPRIATFLSQESH